MNLKRWIALVLCVLMTVSMLPIAAAVDNGATKSTGSCPSEDAKMRNNGKHFYIAEVDEPWCLKSGTCWWQCIYCGDEYEEHLPALGHDFHNDWSIIEEATCSSPGIRVRYCHRCQAVERESYTVDHDFGPWKTDEPATCLEKGLEKRTCKRCGYMQWRYTDALGHLWDDGVITRYPTPEQDGEITFTCKRDPSHKYYQPLPYDGVPTPTDGIIGLELTMVKIGPDKPVYQKDDQVEYRLTMKNTGALDLTYPCFYYTYMIDDAQKVDQVMYTELGVTVIHPDETLSANVFIPINDRAVKDGVQNVSSQAFGLMPDGFVPPKELEDHINEDKFFSNQCFDRLAVGEAEYALTLTVTQTSPAKPTYALGETVEFDVTLANTGKTMMYEASSQRTNVYTHYVEESFYRTGVLVYDDPFPVGDSFTAHCSYEITQEDVDRTNVTLHFVGTAWSVPSSATVWGESFSSNIVEITLPTADKAEYAVELTVTQTSPVKAAYAKGEIVEFDVTLKNASPVSMYMLSSQRTNKYTSIVEEQYYRTGAYIHNEEFLADEGFTAHCAYEIRQEDVDRPDVMLRFDGQGWCKADPDPSTESDQCIYAKPVEIILPTTDQAEYALELTVVQTSPIKTVYQEGDPIRWTAYLKNISDEPVELPTVDTYWAEDGDYFYQASQSIVLAPDEVFECGHHDTIIHDDVLNGHVTFQYTGWAQKVSTGEKVLSNEVTLQWPTAELPPDPVPGDYKLSLNVWPKNPKPQYEVDGYGDTEPISYNAVVTNIGKEPLDFYSTMLCIGSLDLSFHYEPRQRLNPGDSYPFTIDNVILNESQIDIPSTDPNILGEVSIVFTAWGYIPDTEYDVCIANDDLSHVLVEPQPWEPDPTTFSVEKMETSHPWNMNGYMENDMITYDIIVTNTSEEAIHEVVVHDVLDASGGDDIVVVLYDMQPQESRVVTFQYQVDANDVIQKKVINWAWVTWMDPYTEKEQASYSNDVESPTTDMDPPGGLVITKEEVGGPDNGAYYIPGEYIEFGITVENTMDVPLELVDIYDDFPGGLVGSFLVLAPHEKKSFSVFYQATEWDAQYLGSVTNVAWGNAWCANLEQTKYGISNEVTVPVHQDPPKNPALAIYKEETSHPADTYYKLNDTIVYTITVENVGDEVLYDISLYDTLDPSMNEFAHVGILYPHEKQSFTFPYTVTIDDVPDKNNCVINYAIADYFTGDYSTYYSVYAGPVISPTGKNPVPPPPVTSRGDDSCKLTLKGEGGFTILAEQHYCSTHKQVADQADALLSQGAWQQAKDAWIAAVNEEYDAFIKAAAGLAKGAVMEDQKAFNLYLDSYEALLQQIYPNDPGRQAMAECELLKDQCSELCYLLNNAGRMRPDSLYTGSYTAIENDAAAEKCLRTDSAARSGDTVVQRVLCADHGAVQTAVISLAKEAATKSAAEDTFRRARRLWQSALDKQTNLHYRSAGAEARQIIGKNRTLFDQVLEKREELLKQIYPRNPEIVVEVLSNLVRNQVITLCQLW